MDDAQVIDVMRDAITVLLLVAGPIMLIGLGIGLLIGLFQALTQIQEMTLTFVPKIIAIFAALLLYMPTMIETMQAFMDRIANRIVGLG